MRWIACLLVCLAGAYNCRTEASYSIENIDLPAGVDKQIGALAFMPDGRLMVAFNYGKIFAYTPETKTWKLFAQGLHLPLGIVPVSDTELLVMQRPELTRLIDRDADGDADTYENVFDAFGLSGNYHEFAFGPVRDAAGHLYIALNVASNNGGIMPEVRGAFKSFDISQHELAGKFDKKRVSRMYACVPYRGWVMRISPDGRVTPYASGLRSPNGLGFDHKGRLLVTDNQGDWVGTSKLHHIQEGRFYGHPASLAWDPRVTGDPMKLPVSELNRMRQPAAALLPQGLIANSPTQPLLDDTDGRFGPFQNQVFIGEMNQNHLVRFIPDEVGGVLQGTVVPFLNRTKLGRGNNRLAFGPDGSLWVGKIHLKWPGAEGLQRIRYTGVPPFELQSLRLAPRGFELAFTQALDDSAAADPSRLLIKSYRYAYHAKYGSQPLDAQEVLVQSAALSEDGRALSLSLPELKEGYVYEFDVSAVRSLKGEPLASPVFCYNLVRKHNP